MEEPPETPGPTPAGLRVRRGTQLRIPAGALTINFNTGEASLSRVELRVCFWAHWFDIAEENTKRASAVQDSPDDEVDAPPELHSAMVAVSAAAHSIDAFYGDIKTYTQIPPPLSKSWKVNDTPRHRRILETLKLSFVIGSRTSRWSQELEWLFDLRDAVVHPSSNWQEAAVRENILVPPPEVEYSATSAQRALRLARDVITNCLASPKPTNRPLRQWSADNSGLVLPESSDNE